MLRDFLVENREAILGRSRQKASERAFPQPSQEELVHGIPAFFDQLVRALRRQARPLPADSEAEIGARAVEQGVDFKRLGLTASQVVHGYGDVCQAITDLATETKVAIETPDFRTLNRCLDVAIAEAVTEFGHQRERDLTGEAAVRLGSLAHELRNALATATLAYERIKKGGVAIGGSTGAVLGRSLMRLRELIDRSLAEVRLGAGSRLIERVSLTGLIEDVEAAAGVRAVTRGVQFEADFDPSLHVDADRQLLASALGNLVDNALKFTRPRGKVWLRACAAAGRVLIEIEDECGGLPPGRAEELFQPFTQRGADRSGLGLGLAISRKAIEANDGQLRVRNLPGKGCAFTLELPLAAISTVDRAAPDQSV